jgi:pimeloyl-ACP methyl ester carboxylesterase
MEMTRELWSAAGTVVATWRALIRTESAGEVAMAVSTAFASHFSLQVHARSSLAHLLNRPLICNCVCKASARGRRAKVVVLPGMDGSPLLLDGFKRSLGSAPDGPDPTRVVTMQYPRLSHLKTEALCKHIVCGLAPLANDMDGYIIVAQSYSCHAALRVCCRHFSGVAPLPGVFLGLTLVNGFCSPPGPRWLRNTGRLVPPAAFRFQPPSALVSTMFLGATGNTNGEMDIVQAAGGVVDPKVMAGRLTDCLSEDSWAEWRDPVLRGDSVMYLAGSDDFLVGATGMVREMKTARDDIDFVFIEDGPHLLLQRFPESSARAIDEFAKKLEARRDT